MNACELPGLAYGDVKGRIYYDEESVALADGGTERLPEPDELIEVPDGAVTVQLPGRKPLLARGKSKGRVALGVLLPAGYTRLLVPAYREEVGAPTLPLFGYTYACVVNDRLHVAATRTDDREDWRPRRFDPGELEAKIEARLRLDSRNGILAQLRRCSLEYGCFTAQNVFLEQGEAAVPVSPKCNAACVGCISEQRPDAGIPAPQQRIAVETDVDAISRIAIHHLDRAADGIVSFGQGCEGEPLLRATTIARSIERIRSVRSGGTLNCNTNGSLPKSLRMLIDAGLQAIRISLNSFRPATYAAYYRPTGYSLEDVLESIRIAASAGLQVSLNVLTHPGITDDEPEIAAMERFLREVPVSLVQTRTLNIDPARYFAVVGRPIAPVGMLRALEAIRALRVGVGNFTRPRRRKGEGTPEAG